MPGSTIIIIVVVVVVAVVVIGTYFISISKTVTTSICNT